MATQKEMIRLITQKLRELAESNDDNVVITQEKFNELAKYNELLTTLQTTTEENFKKLESEYGKLFSAHADRIIDLRITIDENYAAIVHQSERIGNIDNEELRIKKSIVDLTTKYDSLHKFAEMTTRKITEVFDEVNKLKKCGSIDINNKQQLDKQTDMIVKLQAENQELKIAADTAKININKLCAAVDVLMSENGERKETISALYRNEVPITNTINENAKKNTIQFNAMFSRLEAVEAENAQLKKLAEKVKVLEGYEVENVMAIRELQNENEKFRKTFDAVGTRIQQLEFANSKKQQPAEVPAEEQFPAIPQHLTGTRLAVDWEFNSFIVRKSNGTLETFMTPDIKDGVKLVAMMVPVLSAGSRVVSIMVKTAGGSIIKFY